DFCVVRIHTAEPDDEGIGNEATLDDGTILSADWTEFADGYGGRYMTHTVDIEFGLVTVVETLTWYSLWEANGTTFILADELTTPQDAVIGNPVRFPAGTLVLVGRGAQ